MTLKIALYTLLACAVCVLLALWSWKLMLGIAVVAIIFCGLNGREYEGYL